MSVAQYLANDKKAATDLKLGLQHLHGRKVKKTGTRDPVVINTLRAAKMIDEDESSGSEFGTYDDSESEYNTNSSVDDDEYENDDDDTTIDYPCDIKQMSQSRPSRIMITINDKLCEAVLDTGAALSVINKRLADKLGIKEENLDETIPLGGFGTNGKMIYCRVARNVHVRIGGKLRVEHFCIADAESDKDVCLLGRPWIINHDIRLANRGSTVLVPIKGGRSLLEIECIQDLVEDVDSIRAVYQVHVYMNDKNHIEDSTSILKVDDASKLLVTYQEECVPDED